MSRIIARVNDCNLDGIRDVALIGKEFVVDADEVIFPGAKVASGRWLASEME